MADEGEHRDRGHGIGICLDDLATLHPLGEERALGLGSVLGQNTLKRLEQTRALPPLPSGDLDQRLQANELVEGPAVGDIERLGLTNAIGARGGGPSDLAIDDGNEHRLLVLEVSVEAAAPWRQARCLLDLDDGRAGDALASEQLQRPVDDAFARVLRHGMQDSSCIMQEPSCMMSGMSSASTVTSTLGFARPERVRPDHERPRVRRSATIEPEPLDHTTLAMHECEIRDLAVLEAQEPSLDEAGFAIADLPDRRGLYDTLQAVLRDQRLSPGNEAAIRRSLGRAHLRPRDGTHLLILHVAAEGVLFRSEGPAGIHVHDGPADEIRHGGAVNVHADQDVLGTPLRQLMRGHAPRILRHEAPDSANRSSPLVLVNLWLPLRQLTRPLTLMHSASLDRRRDQCRYGLPTEGILNRSGERAVNDIWAFLHDEAQEWYFHSELALGQAYVFDTLSTAHGSCVLPGEDVAADRYRRLAAVEAAIGERDTEALRAAVTGRGASDVSTASLQQAIATMDALLDEVASQTEPLTTGSAHDWLHRSEAARAAVVRSSIELRALAIRLPFRT